MSTPFDVRGFQGSYRFLSNFWPCLIDWEGGRYLSVEAAYQAAKCEHLTDRKKFEGLTPAQAKRLGRLIPLRLDWEVVKVPTMEHLLRLKFSNSSLRSKLQKTAPGYLEETNTWGDTFWGVCRGRGQNILGILLMNIRDNS